MSLTDWDKAIIERLAYAYRIHGKEPARNAYNKLALAHNWNETPHWIEGRTIFQKYWVTYRKEYNNSPTKSIES